jgi:hypothetical protein
MPRHALRVIADAEAKLPDPVNISWAHLDKSRGQSQGPDAYGLHVQATYNLPIEADLAQAIGDIRSRIAAESYRILWHECWNDEARPCGQWQDVYAENAVMLDDIP